MLLFFIPALCSLPGRRGRLLNRRDWVISPVAFMRIDVFQILQNAVSANSLAVVTGDKTRFACLEGVLVIEKNASLRFPVDNDLPSAMRGLYSYASIHQSVQHAVLLAILLKPCILPPQESAYWRAVVTKAVTLLPGFLKGVKDADPNLIFTAQVKA